MLTDRLTPADLRSLLDRLATNFGGKRDLEAKCDLYFNELRDLPRHAVEEAVRRAIREGTSYFPKVAELRRYASEILKETRSDKSSIRAQYREWEIDPWGPESANASLPCPVCGVVMEWSPRGLVIVHNDEKHTTARCSYSNIGNPAWFTMGPVVPTPPRKPPRQEGPPQP